MSLGIAERRPVLVAENGAELLVEMGDAAVPAGVEIHDLENGLVADDLLHDDFFGLADRIHRRVDFVIPGLAGIGFLNGTGIALGQGRQE